MQDPIEIKAVPEEYRLMIDGDEITVYNDRNGTTYLLKSLAPNTTPDENE